MIFIIDLTRRCKLLSFFHQYGITCVSQQTVVSAADVPWQWKTRSVYRQSRSRSVGRTVWPGKLR